MRSVALLLPVPPCWCHRALSTALYADPFASWVVPGRGYTLVTKQEHVPREVGLSRR